MRAGCGFTFIELIILTLALVILASVGIPRMKPVVQGLRLRGAAWQLAGDLRLARQRAVTSQKDFRLCVSNCAIMVKEGEYSLERDDGMPSRRSWISETGAAIRLPPDVTVSATATTTFSPNGMASGSTYTLSLTGQCKVQARAEVQYKVTVASTGRVSVEKLPCP